jgi:hypothetical protein
MNLEPSVGAEVWMYCITDNTASAANCFEIVIFFQNFLNIETKLTEDWILSVSKVSPMVQ